MKTDLDLLLLSEFLRLAFGAHVKADDDGVRCRCEQHVGFSDGADAGVQHFDLDLFGRELQQ